MKRAISLLLSILVALSLFSCNRGEPSEPSVTPDLPRDDRVRTEHILTVEPPSELFDTVQGAVFDGEHYYIAFVNKYLPNETAIIVKTDKNGSLVKKSEVLPLDHANSLTLLENGDIMVAHCQSPDGHYYRYSVIDGESFELTRTADLDEPFMSIAYCKEKRIFVGGEWNGDKMNVYGRDLGLLYSFYVDYAEGSFPQSYFCTEDTVYAVRCINDGGFRNYLYGFSYGGATLLEYEMDLPRLTEAEAVSVINGEVYIICADYGKCVVYKISNLVK